MMSKIGRNEPCPCGSGKKYKKCCGASNGTEVNPKLINDELHWLHQELISFTTDKYGDKINEQTELYYKSYLHNSDETVDIYNTGLTIWLLFHVPFLENNQTIFDVFYNQYQSKISQETRHIFAKWSHTVPSVYEVLSVDHQKQHNVTVREIQTNETFPITIHEGNAFIEGSLIIGTLIPFVHHHNFFFTVLKLYRHDKDALIQLLQQYSNKDGGLIKHFPDFLANTLALGVDASEWDSESHEEVAQLFANHMVDKNFTDALIFKGVTLWNQYCKKEEPSVKKTESYAAALAYLVQKTFLPQITVTQRQLANEYEASPGTVSTNFRKLSNALTDEIAVITGD